jgi:transposase
VPKVYAPEFRRRVVELARSGRPVAQLAGEFGVSLPTLYKWIYQDRVDHGERPGVPSSESDELRAARRRIRQLEAELEITRKAAEIFDSQGISPKGSSR